LFFFFFSSRRRHTRSLRDWSSDVCSSDLVFQERQLGQKRCELRQQLLRNDERLGAAVGEHVFVFFGGKQRVHGDRNDARLDGTEERSREIDRVGEREQHPVLHLQAHRLKP